MKLATMPTVQDHHGHYPQSASWSHGPTPAPGLGTEPWSTGQLSHGDAGTGPATSTSPSILTLTLLEIRYYGCSSSLSL